jgi:hypothetical protein
LRVLITVFDWRGWNIKASAPKLKLLWTIGLEGLGLIFALKGTVVTLVEPPGTLHVYPATIGCIEGNVCGVDSSLE